MSRIIYLYKRGRHHDKDWHHFKLESYHEEDTYYQYQGFHGKSYDLLERIEIDMTSKNLAVNEVVDYSVTSGKHLSEFATGTTWKEFANYKLPGGQYSEGFVQITRHQYERLRKIAIGIIVSSELIDFDTVKIPEGNSVTFT